MGWYYGDKGSVVFFYIPDQSLYESMEYILGARENNADKKTFDLLFFFSMS
jgi:hypothetical protein